MRTTSSFISDRFGHTVNNGSPGRNGQYLSILKSEIHGKGIEKPHCLLDTFDNCTRDIIISRSFDKPVDPLLHWLAGQGSWLSGCFAVWLLHSASICVHQCLRIWQRTTYTCLFCIKKQIRCSKQKISYHRASKITLLSPIFLTEKFPFCIMCHRWTSLWNAFSTDYCYISRCHPLLPWFSKKIAFEVLLLNSSLQVLVK